jgi:hypothetical protein
MKHVDKRKGDENKKPRMEKEEDEQSSPCSESSNSNHDRTSENEGKGDLSKRNHHCKVKNRVIKKIDKNLFQPPVNLV